MDIDRKVLAGIISADIKNSAQGSLIPDQLIALFIEQCTGYCLTGKWLKTEPIAQWLKGEYDFPPDEIAKLFKGLKTKVKDKVGVELLMPGEALPPEAIPPPPLPPPPPPVEKAKPVAKVAAEAKPPEPTECWGAEWQGEADDSEGDAGVQEEDEGDKLSLVSDKDAAPPGMMVSEDEVDEDDFLDMAEEKTATGKPPSLAANYLRDTPKPPAVPHAAPPISKPLPPPVKSGAKSSVSRTPPPEKCAHPQPPVAPLHPARPASKAPPALSQKDAQAILVSLATGGPEVDPVIAQLARESVITGAFELNVFKHAAMETGQASAVRDALCWLLILEVDHSQYTGLRKIGGMILSEAVKQSNMLIRAAEEKIKPLEGAKDAAAKDIRMDDYEAMGGIADRMKKTIKKLQEITSALSYIPTDTPEAQSTPAKFHDTGPKHDEKKAEARPKKKKKTGTGKSTGEKIKIALAGVFMVCVLAGAGMYVSSLLTKAPTNSTFDAKQFESIIILKEARQSGTTFIAVVDSANWNAFTKDEKLERCQRLLDKVKSQAIQGLLVQNAEGAILAQSYSNEIRVFR